MPALAEAIGGDESRYRRVVFNEIPTRPFKTPLWIRAISIWIGLRPASATILDR